MTAKDKNTFYEGTGFERKMLVIRPEFYEKIRALADTDMKRRLKAGEVMEVAFNMAMSRGGDDLLAYLEQLRKEQYPQGQRKGDLKKAFASLSVEQQAALLAQGKA